MNIFHNVKSSVLLVALISNSVFAQQVLPAARSKEEFPTALALKTKDGRDMKKQDAVDETYIALAAEESESKGSSIITEYVPNPAPQPVIKPQYLGNTPIFISVVQKGTKKSSTVQ